MEWKNYDVSRGHVLLSLCMLLLETAKVTNTQQLLMYWVTSNRKTQMYWPAEFIWGRIKGSENQNHDKNFRAEFPTKHDKFLDISVLLFSMCHYFDDPWLCMASGGVVQSKSNLHTCCWLHCRDGKNLITLTLRCCTWQHTTSTPDTSMEVTTLIILRNIQLLDIAMRIRFPLEIH